MLRLVEGPAVADVLDPYREVDRIRPSGGAWVLANMVGGLDGTAAIGGRVGALTGGADAELFWAGVDSDGGYGMLDLDGTPRPVFHAKRLAADYVQTGDEIEHLPLGGDVERRGGFVADEHERVAREAGGERDTLAHASRQLERIHRRDALGKVDLGESPTHLVVHLVTCHGERGGDLRAASVDGTQARERVLQQQADTSSAHRGERPGPTGEVEARAVDRHRPLGVHA